MSELQATDSPETSLSPTEYAQMKKTGWDMISHGFCLHTDRLSYAQFVGGFELTKQKWLEWFGEDVLFYNAHGAEITDFQYYLLHHLGFSYNASGSAALGCYCASGTTVDVQFKRVTNFDSETPWSTVMSELDNWEK